MTMPVTKGQLKAMIVQGLDLGVAAFASARVLSELDNSSLAATPAPLPAPAPREQSA
ncbi:MAG TPA: hypothetical protein VFT55_13185 [Planctomycetota bacterium]|nr:hypothetical protein [Planctomycetota bacterium]